MLDFTRYQVLTFDCYGTMIDWENGIFSALKPVLAAHGKQINENSLLEVYSELELAAEQEYQPYREVLQSVVRGFGERLGFTPTDQEVNSLPDSVAHWRPFSDTADALRSLKRRYKLAVISNIDDNLFATSAPKLGVAFDAIITAQQARCYKPCEKIFKLAEERLEVDRERWLHVGQSIYHDIIPANALGISSVWVKRASPRPGAGATKAVSGMPDLEVPDLHTLASLAS